MTDQRICARTRCAGGLTDLRKIEFGASCAMKMRNHTTTQRNTMETKKRRRSRPCAFPNARYCATSFLRAFSCLARTCSFCVEKINFFIAVIASFGLLLLFAFLRNLEALTLSPVHRQEGGAARQDNPNLTKAKEEQI